MKSHYNNFIKGIIVCALLLIGLTLFVNSEKTQPQTAALELALSQESNPNSFEIPAESVLVVDTDLNYIYYAKNISEIRPIASITKLMTAMVVIDNYNLAQTITLSSQAVSYIDKNTFIEGETIKIFDLLVALLVESSNEAAYALAENWPHDDGSSFIKQEKFIQAMNKKASEFGMVRTVFSNPSGLDDGINSSSAWDVALLAQKALSYPIIRDITTQPYATIYSEQGIQHIFENTNKLIGTLPSIELGKTGSTDDAGQSLTLAIKKNGTPLIVVLLKAQDRFLNAKEIIDNIKL